MKRERVVLDTNVLISSLFLAPSTPGQAVDKAITNAQLIATTETLRELIKKLHSPKFDRYVGRERRDALLERVASLVEIIDVLASIQTTLNICTHVVDASHRAAIESLEQRLFLTVPKSQKADSVRIAKYQETCWLELEAPPGFEPGVEVSRLQF